MAAISRTNPIILTSVNLNDTTDGDLFIDSVTWVAPAAQDDEVILHNRRGEVILRIVGSQQGDVVPQAEGAVFSGITVNRLDSGTLYIHLR